MKRHSILEENKIISVAILIATIFPAVSLAGKPQQPYYGFFPAKQGKNHKKFVHNIFGFSIEIPSTWVFGVNGTPPTAVVFLYREGMNTGNFSKDYEIIEIGQIPFVGMKLKESQKTVMRGMRSKHPNLKMIHNPAEARLNGRSSISWIYQWSSKTGYTVVEYITLIQSSGGTQSLAVRTTRLDYESRLNFYDGILKTFESFKPKH